jgi:hypothetical protein
VPQQASLDKLSNNSGQGPKVDVPKEIMGWNWGAFVFTIIWGAANSVWESFLIFVPILNVIMVFLLGAYGNKWAWQNKSWDSIENFKKTQKTWSYWGLGVFLTGLISGIIFFIVTIIASGAYKK